MFGRACVNGFLPLAVAQVCLQNGTFAKSPYLLSFCVFPSFFGCKYQCKKVKMPFPLPEPGKGCSPESTVAIVEHLSITTKQRPRTFCTSKVGVRCSFVSHA